MAENKPKEKEENLINKQDSDFEFSDDDYVETNDNKNILDTIYLNEKNLLISMGFKEDLIIKVYKNIHPIILQEAIDYMNKDENDKYIHSFIPNDKNICLICEESQNNHSNEETKIEKDIVIPTTNRVYRDSLEYAKEKKESKKSGRNSYIYNNECGICFEEINYNDRKKVSQPCKHLFCVDCWLDYLKEKIKNANVYKINCMQHECDYSLSEYFVKSIIGKDTQLLQKYDKFLSRRKLMESNKKIKFCPYPDCDGYAEKKNKKEKIVKCNFGHDFCFECGNKPHPKQKCTEMIDKDFEKWKSNRIVKRCPHCKFWTEKNEGCNHMTCVQCKFQWCWLCQKECLLGHYSSGSCKGLHFKEEVDEEKTKILLENNLKDNEPPSLMHRFFVSFGYLMVYLFLCPYLYLISKGAQYMDDIRIDTPIVFFALTFIPFFVCAEIQTVSFAIIISIPALFIPPYYRLLRFTFFSRIFGPCFGV